MLKAVGAQNKESFLKFELLVGELHSIRGHAVAQLVEALRYKPESRGFDSRWCHWIFFSLT